MSGFGVRQDAVAALRATIIEVLLRQLVVPDLRTAFQAAISLHAALQYPHGLVGRIVTDEERTAWSGEFIETLDKIRGVVANANIDPFITIQLQRAVNWHAGFAGPPTESAAVAVLNAIPTTVNYRVSLALADGWGHVTERADDLEKSWEAWPEEQKRIAVAFVSAMPNATAVVEFLRSRLRTLRFLEGGQSEPQIFVGRLLEVYPELADPLCEAVVREPQDPLRDIFGTALYCLSISKPERAIAVATAALGLGDVEIRRRVSATYGGRLYSRERMREDERALAEGLARSDDDYTVIAIIRGIAAQAINDRPWSLATLLTVPIERSPKIADAVFGTFLVDGPLPMKSLGEPTIATFLERLLPCPSIEGHWFERFIAAASDLVPSQVVRFFIRRIEHGQKKTTKEFDPMPYVWHTQLKFREANDRAVLLRMVREWLLGLRKDAATFWGPKLYAMVAGGYDDLVIADLKGWIKTGDAEKLAVIGRLLSEAPSGFVFERREFVVDLLEQAAAASEKCRDSITAGLWKSAVSGMRHGLPGKPFPEDERRRDGAKAILDQISPASEAWQFFKSLYDGAHTDITRKKRDDEELFDDV
jgi:hypothetical protein